MALFIKVPGTQKWYSITYDLFIPWGQFSKASVRDCPRNRSMPFKTLPKGLKN